MIAHLTKSNFECRQGLKYKVWRENTHGRFYLPGKPLSKDLRLLIINNIILEGGDPAAGGFYGKCTNIARSLNVSSAAVSRVWKRFCTGGTASPKKINGEHPSHLPQGDFQLIEHLKRYKPSITQTAIIHELSEIGELPYRDVSTTSVSRTVKYRLPSEKQFIYKNIIRIAQERFTLQNMAYTEMLIDYLHTKDPYTLYVFDECGLKLHEHGTRNYGQAPAGERDVELKIYAETPNITVN